MRLKIYIYLSIVLFTTSQLLLAQSPVAPNLTVGASKVLFEKGQLDADLISEIVTTKQEEVRNEMVKRLIDNNLQNSNIAVRRFVRDNFETLFSEASPAIKKKELLKNAAELALVVGFTEFYFQDIKNRLDEALKDASDYDQSYPDTTLMTKEEFDFIMEYMRNLDDTTRFRFAKTFFPKYKPKPEGIIAYKNSSNKNDKDFYKSASINSKISASLMYYNILEISKYAADKNKAKIRIQGYNEKLKEKKEKDSKIPQFANALKTSKYLPKPEFLTTFKNSKECGKFASERKGDFTSPNHLFIDMVYEVMSTNERVKQFGFFQRVENRNQMESRYNEKKNLFGPFELYFTPLESVIQRKVETLMDYFELIARINELWSRDSGDLEEKLKNGFRIGQNLSEINSAVNVVIYKLKKVQLPKHIALTEDQKKFFEDLILLIPKVQSRDTTNINDYITYLEGTVIPELSILNLTAESSLSELLTAVDSLNSKLTDLGVYYTFGKLAKDISINESFQLNLRTTNEINLLIEEYKPYIQLLKYLSNLDQAITYDRIFKFIVDLGKISADNRVGTMLNTMINYYDKYSIIEEDKNHVVIDLEGLTGDLYNNYQKNIRGKVGLSFTVGLNTAFRFNGNLNFLSESNTDTIGQSSFVSEKIGLRWNVVDFNRQYMKGTKNNKPLIDNIHLNLYTSGLLYQVSALNTSDNWNFTSLGIGAGLTFFNGLDFNISYADQMSDFFKKSNSHYINIGFDIQITEYLSIRRKKKGE